MLFLPRNPTTCRDLLHLLSTLRMRWICQNIELQPFPPLPARPINPQGDTHLWISILPPKLAWILIRQMPTATSSSSVDKGKATEIVETRAETLARLRTKFSGNLENYVTDVFVYHPDLSFELARLIKSVGKWESNEWIQERMFELTARLASMEGDKQTKAKEIAACAHVLGLLLSEKRYYENAEAGIVGFLDSFVGILVRGRGNGNTMDFLRVIDHRDYYTGN